jgi:hypothetical protein
VSAVDRGGDLPLDPGDEVVEPEPMAGTYQQRGHEQLGGFRAGPGEPGAGRGTADLSE